jgi:bzd-type benzoyl-CoA reductase N subunit
MNSKKEIIQQFSELSGTVYNPGIKSWQERGGKVVGLFCSYVPEELFYAAGLLPVRMRAGDSADASLGGPYVGEFTCSFIRQCLGLAFNGGYDFLDGIVCFNSCDHARRIFDVWHRKFKTPFQHYLNVPHKGGRENVDFYRDELLILRKSMEQHFGVDITDAALWQAIGVYNETRDLQRQLYQLRKRDCPPVTGAEALSVIAAGTAAPRDQYNQLLKQLLLAVSGPDAGSAHRPRLMVVGSLLDDPGYIEVVESLGGLVVNDLLCFGTSIFWNSVDEKAQDPLEALARYHLDERVPCARMVGRYSSRLDFIKATIKEFKIDGVICERVKFCDMWWGESNLLKRSLQELNIPVLLLEREYLISGLGQLKTRVQAFLETIQEAQNVRN